MIDLDSTLMDSSEQRDRGLADALLELKDTRKDVRDRIEFFTTNVYKRNDLFQAAVPDFPDVRQQWNHPAWYITYLVFARDSDLQQETQRWSPERVAKAKVEPDKDEYKQFIQWLQTFQVAYRSVEAEEKESISAAMAAFEHVRLYPFKEARDFLGSLHLTGSFKLYIVSEGDPDTQWMKLRGTGLARFFDREHVLTTGDAVQTVEVLRALQEEREKLAVIAADINAQSERLKGSMNHQANMTNVLLLAVGGIGDKPDVIEAVQKVITDTDVQNRVGLSKQINELDKELKEVNRRLEVVNFVKRVIARMGQKGYLYPGAVRAILRNPASPRSDSATLNG